MGIFITLPKREKKITKRAIFGDSPNFVKAAPTIPICIKKNNNGRRKMKIIKKRNDRGRNIIFIPPE